MYNSDELPEDVADWTDSLSDSEKNYRSMAGCKIPLNECPWDEADHAEARIIVHLLDRRDKRIAKLEDQTQELQVALDEARILYTETEEKYCNMIQRLYVAFDVNQSDGCLADEMRNILTSREKNE